MHFIPDDNAINGPALAKLLRTHATWSDNYHWAAFVAAAEAMLEPGCTIQKAADRFGFPKSTIDRAKTILYGGAGYVHAIMRGELTFNKAPDKIRDADKARKAKQNTQLAFPAPIAIVVESVEPTPAPVATIGLTREEVDPDFKGSPIEWVDKYGHVNMRTAEDAASAKFRAWSIRADTLARETKQKRPPAVDTHWLRSPAPPDIKRLRRAIDDLRGFIGEAQQLLNAAEWATAKNRCHSDES